MHSLDVRIAGTRAYGFMSILGFSVVRSGWPLRRFAAGYRCFSRKRMIRDVLE